MKIRIIFLFLALVTFSYAQDDVEYVLEADSTYTEIQKTYIDSLSADEVTQRKRKRFEQLLLDNDAKVITIVEVDTIRLDTAIVVYDEGQAIRLTNYIIDTISIRLGLELDDYVADKSKIDRAVEDVERARERVTEAWAALKKEGVSKRRQRELIWQQWNSTYRAKYNQEFRQKKN